MASDCDTNDLVLFPNDFASLQLPELLVCFFDKFDIHYKTENSFSMGILRSLYKTDYKCFYSVIFFLSLYGCNFHSVKNNSFFPTDVNDEEDVLVFSGSADASFSIPDMSKYGIWDFFTNAASSKCILLNGVVTSRLRKMSGSKFSELANRELFSIKRKRLYGFVGRENDSKTVSSDEGFAESPDNLRRSRETEGEDEGSSVRANCDSDNGACEIEKENDLSFPLSSEFFQGSLQPENEESTLKVVTIYPNVGACSPRFWIRFIASFFAMDNRAKEIYSKAGYNTFGDLSDFKKEDIKLIVDGLNDCVDDPYLVGIYEGELICYCQNRDSFLTEFGENQQLKDFLLPSEYTVACIQRRPNLFYYFDSESSSFLSSSLDKTCHKLASVSNFAADYLKMFGIIDLSFVGAGLLSRSINDYHIETEEDCRSYFLRPFSLIDSLLSSLMERSPCDAFGIDHEVYALWVPIFIQRFYHDLGKYGQESHKKHLEILNLRERTGVTLEELGKRYGVTRERIRQIEAKTAKNLQRPAERLVDSLFQIQNFLPLCFVNGVPGLYSYVQSKESKYYVDGDLGLVLRKASKKIIDRFKSTIFESDTLKDCFHLDGFYRKNHFSFYGWLNKISYHLQYNPYPKYMAQKGLLKDFGKQYLLSKGVAGYDVNKDENELMEFYRTKAPYMKNVTYKSLTNDVIRSGAVLRGMSVYISPEFVTEEQKKVVERILAEENFGPYGFTGLSLFEKHKEGLMRAGIDNGYFFYGIAAAYNSESYQFGGRSLRITRNCNDSLDEMAEHYISKEGPIVKVDDLLHALHIRIPALQQIKNVTKYDSSTLVLKSWLKWTKQEFIALESFIDEKIKRQGFCHAYDIIESPVYFDENQNGFFKTNKIGNVPSRLIYFFDAMAERYEIAKYHFSHHCNCISFVDNPIETKADMAVAFFKGRTFAKKEADTFFKKFHLSGTANGADFYSKWAYFVDNDTLILKQDVKISDDTIKQVSDLLEEYYGDELYVTSLTALNRLKLIGYREKFDESSMEMAFVLSESDCSNWSIPVNDIAATSGFFRTMLVNKKLVGHDASYSSLIRSYILKNHRGSYLSIQEIQKELKEQELIDNHVSVQMLNSIFSMWFSGPIVEVPDESKRFG